MTSPFCPDISEGKKDPLYFNFNVFSTKVMTGGRIFKPPTGDEAATLCGHPSHLKVSLAVLSAKACSTFISQLFFKTFSIRTRDIPLCSQALYRLSLSFFFLCLSVSHVCLSVGRVAGKEYNAKTVSPFDVKTRSLHAR